MEVKLDKELRVVLKREPLPGFKPKKGNKASTFSTASKLVARAKKRSSSEGRKATAKPGNHSFNCHLHPHYCKHHLESNEQ